MQTEITEKTVLLNSNGNIGTPGWARKPLFSYGRNMIKAPAWRIKEWDYYCVMNDNDGIALTVADNGYMAFYSVTVFDFKNKTETSGSVMGLFPMGKLNLPGSTEEGDVVVNEKGIRISFLLSQSGNSLIRTLEVDYPAFDGDNGLSGSLVLEQPLSDDSMVIATPFDKSAHFYFNRKINCMKAEGSLISGRKSIDFTNKGTESRQDSELPSTGSYAVLDWGRGVWTYNNTWYWGSGSGIIDGKRFGFNIGYGFGDTSAATENIIFYDGRGHKFENVTFNIPVDSKGCEQFTEPWTFTSSDGRFEMEFKPLIDRFSDTNILIIRSCQHQVFGKFSGRAVLDDGTALEIKDFMGFAEKVLNRW